MKQTLPAILAFSTLVLAVTAAPPRNPVLTIWDCDTPGEGAGWEAETAKVKQGAGAVRWRNHPERPGVEIPGVPEDWTGYHILRFWLHSATAVPTAFMVIVRSENPAVEGMDYWGYKVPINFRGWREIVLPVNRGGGVRSPRGWDQIDGISLTAAGWGNTPHPEADLLIDDVRLEYAPPRPGPRLTDQEFFEELDLSRPRLAAVREAVAGGDLKGAKAAFLEYLRQRTQPRWWMDWRERPEAQPPLHQGSKGWDYFVTGFNVDWTGWKEFVLPLQDWGKVRKPQGWQRINSLGFSSTYGDRTPNAETVLILDGMELRGPDPFVLGDFEDREDFSRWPRLRLETARVRQGSAAARWHVPTATNIKCTDMPKDWRPYTALRFLAHAEKATGDRITIVADSDIPNVSQADDLLRHVYGGYHLGEDIDWESNNREPTDPAFTKEWTYGLNRFRHWRTLGAAYWTTGEEKYAREWIA